METGSPATPVPVANADAVIKPPRIWPPLVLVALYWAIFFAIGASGIPMFMGFLMQMGAMLLIALIFMVWWLANRRIRLTDRFLVLGTAIVVATITLLLLHPSVVKPSVVFLGVPISLTAFTICLAVVRNTAAQWQRLSMIAVLVLTWIPFTLVRMEGLTGGGNPDFRWRWSASAEQRFLAEQAQKAHDAQSQSAPDASSDSVTLQAGDWPAFRGAGRDGKVYGTAITTDWSANPPKLVWRNRAGPSWSSMLIVDGRLYTQEQRGPSEAVVCLEANTGREIWSHEDVARFEEQLGGIGPRATPTFADGRIYSLGATGMLNCLNAASGEPVWLRNIAEDSGAKIPMWGFSGSPLVTGGLVIVFAGGTSPKNLLAYHAESGEPAWTAPAPGESYSSPQLSFLAGKDQILLLSDAGLTAFDAAVGTLLWKYALATPGEPRVVQPCLVDDADVLFSGANSGTTSLTVRHDAEGWHTIENWVSHDLKPFFNDYVLYDGSLYGFDGKIFCCVDAQAGEGRWKQGRYGNGQVLLLADQRVLLVLSESGEVVLLAANPKQHEELARFQAVNGKTWSYPAIAHGRLYARNAEEIACFELPSVSAN